MTKEEASRYLKVIIGIRIMGGSPGREKRLMKEVKKHFTNTQISRMMLSIVN